MAFLLWRRLPPKPYATMQVPNDPLVPNPLNGLIPDETYALLEEHNLLNEKGVRDFQIRQRFRVLREEDIPAYDAIEQLRDDYPYLQFDTIRKIVYRMNHRRSS